MGSDEQLLWLERVAVFMMGMALGAVVAGSVKVDRMQNEAVKHHAAHFHSDTGAFIWNDETGHP